MLSLVENYKEFLVCVFQVKGRVTRLRYWQCALSAILASLLLFAAMSGIASLSTQLTKGSPLELLCRAVFMVVIAIWFWHGISFQTMGIRRWRDVTGNGWNFLWGYIPIVGIGLSLFTFCRGSNALVRGK